MEEKLAGHEVEWEVVKSPAEKSLANLVIKALEVDIVVVLEAALPSKNGNTLEEDPDDNCSGRSPPDDWVANEVNVAVVSAPEVDTTGQDGPGWWT